MAQKLLLLKGISGSGKSTYAKGLTREKQYFRVNRDEIRPLISDTKWAGWKEKVVFAVERAMAAAILGKGYSCVVDDTNLSKSTQNSWKKFAEEHGVGFDTKEIKTPLAECIARDSLRIGSAKIGRAVIERQALRSGMYNLSNEPNSLIISDLDGTLADGSHREYLLKDKSDKKRWLKYFDLCDKDEPIQEVIDWLKALKADGKTIAIVSGRAADLTLDKTIAWLGKYEVPYDRLWMRLPGDGREDTIIKKEILDEYLLNHNKESILFCIEDRPRIKKMWQQNGLGVIDVGYGIDF